MSSEEARKQLGTAAEVVQSATGENWQVEVALGVASCSNTQQRWSATWKADSTSDRATSYEAVRQALESAGFPTYVNAPQASTPVLSAQTENGFGLDFSIPIDDGPVGLSISSDCFTAGEQEAP